MPLFTGSRKNNTLTGTSGDDTIFGNGGNDSLMGLDGADIIDGGTGADTVYAGEGDDTVTVGRADQIHGDGGDDRLFFTGSDPTGASTSVNGDAGVDTFTLDFSACVDAVNSSNGNTGYGSIAGISYMGVERLAVTGGSASDTLIGGFGDDTLVGNGGNDRLDGRAGVNVLVGGAGRDIGLIDLSATLDKLVVDYTGADTVVGGTSFVGIEALGLRAGLDDDAVSVANALGSSEIFGGGGNDELNGANAWSDTLDGGEGNDKIVFGRGDNVHGGLGADTLVIFEQALTGPTTLVNGDDGGTDTLVLNFASAFDSITSSNSGVTGSFAGISYSNVERLVITGGTASDTLVGGTGSDTISGGTGNDRLDGRSGFNQLAGGQGRDIGLIDDTASMLGLNIVFVAGSGSIASTTYTGIEGLGFKAGGGEDSIDVRKAKGGSELFGGSGADTLTGCRDWADTLDGGSGDDVIRFNHGDSVRGGDGFDDLRIAQAPVAGKSTSVNGDLGDDTLRIDLSAMTVGVTSSNGNTGSGSLGGISYSGIEFVELRGGSGADSLVGGQGSDSLFGGAGADTIVGQSDTDYLTGGLGADRLSGGLGVDGDVFIYLTLEDSTVDPSERDLITDFLDQDRIDLRLLDANTATIEDDAFTFIGGGAFNHVAGELRYSQSGAVTTVMGDVDGDGAEDFAIDLTGTLALGEGDFML
ncbi:MAG TPA: hypothetical protein VF559_10145 [Caulobacteraceae bacterium]|jgi:Ca2+-binding RTX toxin-like protein